MSQNFLEHNTLKKFPHLADSCDISPSDFSLFEKVNNALI
jgi:hypothetical protein